MYAFVKYDYSRLNFLEERESETRARKVIPILLLSEHLSARARCNNCTPNGNSRGRRFLIRTHDTRICPSYLRFSAQQPSPLFFACLLSWHSCFELFLLLFNLQQPEIQQPPAASLALFETHSNHIRRIVRGRGSWVVKVPMPGPRSLNSSRTFSSMRGSIVYDTNVGKMTKVSANSRKPRKW